MTNSNAQYGFNKHGHDMKAFIKAMLQSYGLDIMSFDYSREYIYDRFLLQQLRNQKISCVLDIGANIGSYGKLLRGAGYGGEIYSFEPCMQPYKALMEASCKDPNWHTQKIALSDIKGTAKINVMAGSELSSLLMPAESSTKMSIVGQEEIIKTTIDDLDLAIDWSTAFVKIDTQGHDLSVIKGGTHRLLQIPLLQTEISFLPIYENMPTYCEVIEHLRSIGFDVLGLFPVSRDSSGRAQEFDCLSLNRNHTSSASIS